MPDSAVSSPRPASTPTPSFQPSPRLSALGLAVLLTGGFVVVFDTFVVNVAIPALRTDLGADLAETGLVIAAYALTFGAGLILGGRLGDKAGRRRIFMLGMLVFSVASLLCGLAPSPLMLILARVLQGAGAALLFPQIYSLLRVLHDDAGRSRAFGFFGMTLGLAAIVGQLLGGLMVWGDLFGLGWRVIFFVNLPVGFATLALARSIPESRVSDVLGFDLAGTVLATLGFVLLLVPLLEGPALGWPLWTGIALAAACVVLGLFWRHEGRLARRGGQPAIDPALVCHRGFLLSILAVLLVYSTPASFFLCFTITVQSGLGLNTLASGSLLTPMSIGFVAASLAAPNLVRRFGAGAVIGGMALYALGFLWLRAVELPASSGSASLAIYILGMMLFGFGQGLSGPPLLNIAIGFIDKERAGMAGGIISTVQQLGAAFGIAFADMIFGHGLALGADMPSPERHMRAFSAAIWLNVAVMVVAVVLMVCVRLGQRRRTC